MKKTNDLRNRVVKEDSLLFVKCILIGVSIVFGVMFFLNRPVEQIPVEQVGLSDINAVNWVSPGKIIVTNYFVDADVSYNIQVHRGSKCDEEEFELSVNPLNSGISRNCISFYSDGTPVNSVKLNRNETRSICIIFQSSQYNEEYLDFLVCVSPVSKEDRGLSVSLCIQWEIHYRWAKNAYYNNSH